jgi:hypothetical protein
MVEEFMVEEFMIEKFMVQIGILACLCLKLGVKMSGVEMS